MTLAEAKESLDMYHLHHRPCGQFLEAVLANNLLAVISHADESTLSNLAEIVRYVYSHLPGECQGSYPRVTAWIYGPRQDAAAEK